MSRGCPAWAQGEGGLRHQDPAALARHLDLVVPVTQRRLPFGDRSVEVDVAAKPTIGSVLLFVTLVPLAALGGFPPRFSLNDEGLDRLDGRIIVRSFHAAFLVWSVFFASVHVDVLVVHIRVDVDVAPSIDKPIFISDLADNALAYVVSGVAVSRCWTGGDEAGWLSIGCRLEFSRWCSVAWLQMPSRL